MLHILQINVPSTMVDVTKWQSVNQEDTTSPADVEEVTRETERNVNLPVFLTMEDVILEQVALSTRLKHRYYYFSRHSLLERVQIFQVTTRVEGTI